MQRLMWSCHGWGSCLLTFFFFFFFALSLSTYSFPNTDRKQCFQVSKYLSIRWWVIRGHWFYPISPRRTLISYRRDGYLPSLFLMEECASQIWCIFLAISFVSFLLSRQKMVWSWAPATYFPPRNVTQVFLACPLLGGTQDECSAVGSPQWAQGHRGENWLWGFTHLNPVKSLRFD